VLTGISESGEFVSDVAGVNVSVSKGGTRHRDIPNIKYQNHARGHAY